MHSMTGYGQKRLVENGREMVIELKSVNHRFLDINLRMPRGLLYLEELIRKSLSIRLQRGHVDVFFSYRNTREDARTVSVDQGLAAAYEVALAELARLPGISDDRTVSFFASLQGILTVTEAEDDMAAVENLCHRTLAEAITSLLAMRAQEGNALRADLAARLASLCTIVAKITERAPLVVTDYKQRLDARIAELLGTTPDPQRMAQEVALFADRAAIDEEIVRLESHMQQFREGLTSEEPIGRKLDFVTQEMGREINTIGSKASDVTIASLVVEAKAELEKMREQVQNVE